MSHGVEGVGSWRAQRRPRDIEVSTPLAGVAAHELESSVDGAAFNPVAAAATTSARCSLVKAALKTPSSSSSSSSASPIVNVHARPRLYLGPVISEASKEDAMEPEVKEEDERRSSTPSPEVILLLFFYLPSSISFSSLLFYLLFSLAFASYLPLSLFLFRFVFQSMHDAIDSFCSARRRTMRDDSEIDRVRNARLRAFFSTLCRVAVVSFLFTSRRETGPVTRELNASRNAAFFCFGMD